jgi:hypothetical protein
VEYLYVPCVCTRDNGREAGKVRWVQAVPIVKKTAALIYYTSDSWNWRKAVVSLAASAASSSRPIPGARAKDGATTGTRLA